MSSNCVLSIKKNVIFWLFPIKWTTVGMGELITNIIFAICNYDNDNDNKNIHHIRPVLQQRGLKPRNRAQDYRAKDQNQGLKPRIKAKKRIKAKDQSQGLKPRIKAKDQSQGSKPRIKAKDIIAVGQQHSINTTERRCRENRLQKRQMHKTVKECILCIDVLLSRRRCYSGVFQSTPL